MTWAVAVSAGAACSSGKFQTSHVLQAMALGALAGEAIAGQLRQSIVDTNSPALAESTIRRKGFSKPLVDTGHMLQSVDYEVKK